MIAFPVNRVSVIAPQPQAIAFADASGHRAAIIEPDAPNRSDQWKVLVCVCRAGKELVEVRACHGACHVGQRNLPGLAERDRLALLALVTTGLRRSELCALEGRDLEFDGRKRSLLVRCGKGGKARRQRPPAGPARELRKLRDARHPEPTDPVLRGLGGRLQETILADIIRRAAKRAGIEKHATAHTLRHTAATWLRQERGDTRLVAEYLGHSDLSTVSRSLRPLDGLALRARRPRGAVRGSGPTGGTRHCCGRMAGAARP